MSDEREKTTSEGSIGQSASTGGLEREFSDAAALMAIAREAGIAVRADRFGRGTFIFSDVESLRRILREEREACAKVCEGNDMSWADNEWNSAVMDCAVKIRARSNKI